MMMMFYIIEAKRDFRNFEQKLKVENKKVSFFAHATNNSLNTIEV